MLDPPVSRHNEKGAEPEYHHMFDIVRRGWLMQQGMDRYPTLLEIAEQETTLIEDINRYDAQVRFQKTKLETERGDAEDTPAPPVERRGLLRRRGA